MPDSETNEIPVEQEIIRDEEGRFVKGVSGNPAGRPKDKTIKERVREWLEQHPDDMDAFVKHFVKENKELAWQMMEGRPPQKSEVDVKTDGKPITAININNPLIKIGTEEDGDREVDYIESTGEADGGSPIST